jgi:hypothetical protein
MPDLGGVDLLREWQAAMQSVAASVTAAAGRSDVARQLLAPLQRQAELFQRWVSTRTHPRPGTAERGAAACALGVVPSSSRAGCARRP